MALSTSSGGDASPSISHLDADYLVYGAGAFSMSFVDVLVTESQATLIIVDNRAQPGGHWNDAYPFVRLHQPSSFYGVNSTKLEQENRDFSQLSSKSEILAYYESLMERFLATGRVQYFPMCQGKPMHQYTFSSLLDASKTFEVNSRAKIVDATYMNIKVPSRSLAQERYEVEEGATVIPLNELVRIHAPHTGNYVVIGAGKTAMDAVMWLLKANIDVSRIFWIVPRDLWNVHRSFTLPDNVMNNLKLLDAIRSAETPTELFIEFEKAGFLSRIDTSILPQKNRCAILDDHELASLRRVQNVVRLGHVLRVERERVLLEKGILSTGSDPTVHVDCSSDGLSRRPIIPVFAGQKITLQSLGLCQPSYHAAVIAHVEARSLLQGGVSDAAKNAMCSPVPHPVEAEDFVSTLYGELRSQMVWLSDAEMRKWTLRSRLNRLSYRPSLTNVAKWAMQNPQQVRRVLNDVINGQSKQSLKGLLDKLTSMIESKPSHASHGTHSRL